MSCIVWESTSKQIGSCGRVVKATDSKSVSLWERRFESYQLRYANNFCCCKIHDAPGEARTHNPGITRCTVYKYRALTDCATGAH